MEAESASWSENPTTGLWNWSLPANWTPATQPVSGATTSLVFTSSGTSSYISHNDFLSTLNRISIYSSSSSISTIQGNELNFVKNGETGPSIYHASVESTYPPVGAFVINNNITFNTEMRFDGSGSAGVTLNGNISGTGPARFYHRYNIAGSYNVTGSTIVSGNITFAAGTIQNIGSSLTVDGIYDSITDFGSNSFSVPILTMKGGVLSGTGTITAVNQISWTQGEMRGNGTTIAQAGIVLENAPNFRTLNRTLQLHGISNAGSSGESNLNLGSYGNLVIASDALFNGNRLSISGGSTAGVYNGAITNNGALNVGHQSDIQNFHYSSSNFVNNGTIHVKNGRFHGTNSTFINNAGGVIHLNDAWMTLPTSTTIAAGSSIIGTGSISLNTSQNTLTIEGLISPGDPAGILTITSNAAFTSTSELAFTIGGIAGSQLFSKLVIQGICLLDGTLILSLANGFESQISASDSFDILTSGSVLSGSFDNVANGGRLTTVDGYGSFLVSYTGNTVTISNYQAIPEPSSYLLILLSSCLFFWIKKSTYAGRVKK